MKKRITAVLVNAELIVMSLIVLIPVIWVVLSGFQTGGALGNISFSELTLDNFKRLFAETNYKLWFYNTLKIAICNTIVSVILMTIW